MPKLNRKTQKIFASSASDVGVFGSAQSGSSSTSTDPATIQSASYLGGLGLSTLSAKRLLPQPELNGLHYVETYQLAYLMQEGLPEYDSATTYYANSLVKKSGTTQIYKSLTDNNTGNALTNVVNWSLCGDLSNSSTSVKGFSYLSSPIILSNNITNPNTQIDFAAGNFIFTNGSNSGAITAITKTIQSSGSWTAGTNQNGLDTGTRANSTWYHSYAIQNNTSGAFDVLFSTSATSPTIPSGWTNVYKIKNGQVYTDSSGNIRPFLKFANGFTKYTNAQDGIPDYSVGNGPAPQNNTLISISVPNQTNIGAIVKAYGETGTTGNDVMSVAFDGSVFSTINLTSNALADIYVVGDSSRYMSREKLCITNSAQIRFTITTSLAARTLTFFTLGYYDLNAY
jgi:hypothetical protein